jgi:hypothetical protein
VTQTTSDPVPPGASAAGTAPGPGVPALTPPARSDAPSHGGPVPPAAPGGGLSAARAPRWGVPA